MPRRRQKQTVEGPRALELPDLHAVWPHCLVVFLALLTAYAATLPRLLVLEDDGEFVAAARHLAVAHPPGYPLFVLLAKPFTWLPLAGMAVRVHLASAVFGAAACACLWWVARVVLTSVPLAYLAALAYGLSAAFWSQAVIADVYTLNALIFFLLLGLCLAYARQPSSTRLATIALAFGLGLSNHWPLLLLASPCLALVLCPAAGALRRDLIARPHLTAVPFVLGLLPYAWLYLRARTAPELAFYGALDGWGDVWHFVSRAGYSELESSPSAGVDDKLLFLGLLGREGVTQYTQLGAGFAAVGFAASWRAWPRSVGLGLLAALLGGTLGLVLLLQLDFDVLTQTIFRPYPLIPWGVTSLWMALGVGVVAGRLRHVRRRAFARLALATGVLMLVLWQGIGLNDRRTDDFADDYARTLLASFDRDAVVVTHADVTPSRWVTTTSSRASGRIFGSSTTSGWESHSMDGSTIRAV